MMAAADFHRFVSIRARWSLGLFFLLGCSPPTNEGLITASLTVSQLPALVTVNQEAAEVGRIEYSWKAVFDTSGDQKVGQGDVALVYFHAKEEGAAEAPAAIFSLRPDVMLYASDTRMVSIGDAEVRVEGATIVLTTSTAMDEVLTRVTPKTWVYFEAGAYDTQQETVRRDGWPGLDQHNVPSDEGEYADRAGDVDLRWIDLINMGVLIQVGDKLASLWRPGD